MQDNTKIEKAKMPGGGVDKIRRVIFSEKGKNFCVHYEIYFIMYAGVIEFCGHVR